MMVDQNDGLGANSISMRPSAWGLTRVCFRHSQGLGPSCTSLQSPTKATAETPLHKMIAQARHDATNLNSGLGKSGLYLLGHMEVPELE